MAAVLSQRIIADLRRSIEVVSGSGRDHVPVRADVLRQLLDDVERLKAAGTNKVRSPG
jgi:hypothetical protein